MTYGLSVSNTAGSVQIDNTYKNMSLQQKIPYSLGAGGETTITQYNSVNPMLFFRPTSGSVGVIYVSLSGSTFTWQIRAGSASSGDIYIFDQPNAATTSSYGLKVFDSSGNDIFNSDNKYLRVVEQFNCNYSVVFGNPQGAVGGSVTRTYPAGTYAVGMAQARLYYTFSGSNFTFYTDGVSLTSTSVTVSQGITRNVTAGTPAAGLHTGFEFLSGNGYVPAITINVEGY